MDYTYPRPATLNARQLGEEIASILQKPHSGIFSDQTQVRIVFDPPLSPAEEAQLATIVASHVADPYWQQKQAPWLNIKWARISAIDIGQRTITLERTIGGTSYTRITNIVSYGILQAYKSGNLAVGDVVLIDFQEDDPSKIMVVEKVMLL